MAHWYSFHLSACLRNDNGQHNVIVPPLPPMELFNHEANWHCSNTATSYDYRIVTLCINVRGTGTNCFPFEKAFKTINKAFQKWNIASFIGIAEKDFLEFRVSWDKTKRKLVLEKG